MRYTNIVAILVLVLAAGCFMKSEDIGLDKLQTHWDQVKDCMDITEEIKAPKVVVEEGSSVMCGGFERLDCYRSETHAIYIPQKTNETNIRHAMVHAALEETTGDLDQDHSSEYFLKCSGIIVNDDTE